MAMSDLPRQLTLLLLVVAGLTGPGEAHASTFRVNPTQIVLSARSGSALVTLTNDSDRPLRFQLSAFRWDQSVDGEMILEPTGDVLFFPKLLTLAPKEARRIRVALKDVFGTTETTYRLFVEELPPGASETAAAGVSVRMRMGIPIFAQPPALSGKAALESLRLQHGAVTFDMKNTGNVHFIVQTYVVRALDRDGGTLYEEEWSGWYVLAGSTRRYRLEVPPDILDDISVITAEARIGSSTLKDRLEVRASHDEP